jgi:hypothetical protein
MIEHNIVSYHNDDTRFLPLYDNSRKHSKNILPLQLQEIQSSKEFNKFLKYKHPRISRCWGERYENCQILKSSNKNKCSKSYITVRDPSIYYDTTSNTTDENMELKKINSNTFIDNTRIPNYQFKINSAPDYYQFSNKIVHHERLDTLQKYDPQNKIDFKTYHDNDIIEGFEDSSTYSSDKQSNYNTFILIILLLVLFVLLYKYYN